MRIKRLMLTLICAIATLTNGASVIVQAAPQEKSSREVMIQESTVVITAPAQEGHAPARVMVAPRADGDTFVFVSGEMSFDGKVVKGAPYSAQAVTESIQTLGDGNRIVRKNTAQVYRDSEGRTRREQTLGAVGPYAAREPKQMIFINDPVSGTNYILDANNKTARKIEVLMSAKTRDMVKAETEVAVAATKMRIEEHHRAGAMKKRRHSEGDGVFIAPVPPPGVGIAFGGAPERIKFREPKVESLGKQNVEGVEAEGKRSTITIAAGEIGNEQPINIVDETWYSPELQTVVMSRHSDPRMGETIYRLTGINRTEPARSLFELPADYTVEEVIPGNMKFKLESELQKAREKKEKQM